MKRSKLVTTIGPASDKKEIMKELFFAGMTTIRLNFSHGTREEQLTRIQMAKDISEELQKPISVMLDTKGPEIRVGKFEGNSLVVTAGEVVTFYTTEEDYKNRVANKGEMTVTYDMSKDLEPGKVVLVDDGKLQLKITDVQPGKVITEAINSHNVKTNKRVNLPGTKFSMPFLSDKDIEDIRYGAHHGIDFIAGSFVNTPGDIKQIKKILKEEKAEHITVYAKIESQYAVDHFDEIMEVADGAMVARGDLGLEIPYYEVPVAQKMMIRKCRELGKPVIVATQMLDSMEHTPSPTRAEVTDVYLATELGADATMLSGESAAGNYPVLAVEVMSKINRRAEQEFYKKLYYEKQLAEISKISYGPRSEIAKHVAEKCKNGEFKFAVTLSNSGRLLSEVARFRPNTTIIGVTADKNQVTQFGLTSSVYMDMDTTSINSIKADTSKGISVAKKYGAVEGDKIIVVRNDEIKELTV